MKIGFGGEIASVAAAIATAVVLIPFMHSTMGHDIKDCDATESSFAFVTLNAEEESAAVRAARSSWQPSSNAFASEQARLAFDVLPETREPGAVGEGGRTRMSRPSDIEWTPPPLPPSLAAPPPAKEEDPDADAMLPFSRREMLKLP